MTQTPSWAAGTAYDISFARLCSAAGSRLLSLVGSATSGRDLLDVGTGTGRTATEAWSRGFRVTAVDPSEEMLAVARSRAPQNDVRWLDGAAPALPVASASFDAAVANFVVNHVPHPRQTLQDIARTVRPAGVVGTTIWMSERSPLTELWRLVVEESGALPVAGTPLPPEQDFPRTVDGLVALHEEAGLQVEVSERVEWEASVDLLDLWQGPAAGIAGIGAVVLGQSQATRAAMFEAYRAAAEPWMHAGCLRLPLSAALVVSRAVPGSSRAHASP